MASGRYSIQDILNEIKWNPKHRLQDMKIVYLHRGAPGDRKSISGSDIRGWSRSFLYTQRAAIPFHRIQLIFIGEEIFFERNRSNGETKSKSRKQSGWRIALIQQCTATFPNSFRNPDACHITFQVWLISGTQPLQAAMSIFSIDCLIQY